MLTTCNSLKEARRIGDAALAARRAACYDVFPRLLTRYFWPPRRRRIAEGKGALLVLETLKEQFAPLAALIRARHSDRLPFIGALRMERVSEAYLTWMVGELRRSD